MPAPEGFLVVARVVAPHGVQGEVRCQIITDFPERFSRTTTLYVGDPPRPYEVESARFHRGMVIIKLKGVASRSEAESLVGQCLLVPEAEAVKLGPGQYYIHQIVGLRVITKEGRPLGRITEVLATGGNEVYVVRQDRKELLIPAIKEVVKEVDLKSGTMTVELLPGLE